jgi:YHS domain-containing protein
MKSKFIKCKSCSSEISSEKCEYATYTTIIDGKEYTFCCMSCAKEYEQKQAK